MTRRTEALKLALQSIEDGETGHAAQILREALALVNEVDQEQPAQQQEPVAREQVLVEHIEYQKAQTQKYFELYNQVCETAQLRLREIARMEARLAAQQEPGDSMGIMEYEEALARLGLNPDIRLRQMFELGKLAAQPAQPSKPWVGLTDEERDDLLGNYITAEGRARAIEAKLREKNA